MVEMKGKQVLVSCNCPRCKTSELVDVPTWEGVTMLREGASANTRIQMARTQLETRGWFLEKFPKRVERDFCPRHAPAYRTAFHNVMKTDGVE